MSKNYEVLNELVPKTQELHRAIFDEGYEQGRQQVIDKIRAEINNILSDEMIHKKTVLGIIDKYKTENEG